MRSRLVLSVVCFIAAVTVHGATITVTGNGDAIAIDGQCSLREAITASNTNVAVNECAAGAAGLDTIAFNFAGATTIAIGAVPLPAIIDRVSIDGATLVTIDGGNLATTGLDLVANASTIRGVTIRRFTSIGIRIRSSNNVVAGNVVDANGGIGISIDGTITPANDNLIGGATTADRNVVTNNGSGIRIEGSVAVAALRNTIRGNYVGLAANGTTVAGNSGDGISLVLASATTIVGNKLDGNGAAGLHLQSSTGTLIQDNNIDRTNFGLASGGEGVLLEQSSGNTIGAAVSGGPGGNFISGGFLEPYGRAVAVRVASGTNNSILTNRIHQWDSNTPGLGGARADNPIDLGTDGPTPNDPCDADTGANHLQNNPVIIAATSAGITGYIDAAPSSTFTIEFFRTRQSFGAFLEPQVYLGHTTVTTDASCRATFHVALGAASAAQSRRLQRTRQARRRR
jgi:parallel beta-helix repeat protein